MKNIKLILLLVLLLLLVGGGVYFNQVTTEPNLEVNNVTNNFVSIDVPQFSSLMDSGDYTVIDLRTPEEIMAGKVSGEALELDYRADDFESRLSELDKSQPYLVYCRSGGRSGSALEVMKGMGFVDVKDLDGGIIAWQQSGREVVSNSN